MPMHDFECPKCGNEVEEIVKVDEDGKLVEKLRCDACGEAMEIIFKKAPVMFSTIVPDYPGSKKIKAGYVHTHGDKSATKVQSGAGGCVNPK